MAKFLGLDELKEWLEGGDVLGARACRAVSMLLTDGAPDECRCLRSNRLNRTERLSCLTSEDLFTRLVVTTVLIPTGHF